MVFAAAPRYERFRWIWGTMVLLDTTADFKIGLREDRWVHRFMNAGAIARRTAGIVLAAVVAIPATLPARTPGASSRALGMGDAVRAVGLGTSGLYFNPACLSQIRQYAIDAGYGYQGGDKVHNLHVSVSDSQTNPEIAAGFAYTYSQSNLAGARFKGHDIRAAASTAFGDEGLRFGFGAGFRYLKVSGKDPVTMGSFDVGAVLSVRGLFHVGVSGQNLVTRSKEWAPRLLGAGTAVTVSNLTISGEVTLDFDSRPSTKASPGFGAEYIAFEALAVRAGFYWDRVFQPDQKRVSGGLGYISQYVGVDVGYAHDVQAPENWLIESSVRVFLP